MFGCFTRFTVFVYGGFLQGELNCLVAIFIHLQSVCNRDINYIYFMYVEGVNTNLVRFLKQRFTLNGRVLSFLLNLLTPFWMCFHVYGPLFCNCKQLILRLLVCFVISRWRIVFSYQFSDTESIRSKCLPRLRFKLLIAFLIGVTTFLAFFKNSIEQSNGWSDYVFLT